MYADPVARGGVLEPEGIVEIKFRVPDLLKAMHRLDPVIRGLKEEAGPDFEQAVKDRETALLPVYRQVGSPAETKQHVVLSRTDRATARTLAGHQLCEAAVVSNSLSP